jgi:hypothetical protein
MPTYEFWYTEEVIYKAGFEAESYEQAEGLLIELQNGVIATTELPEFGNTIKGSELQIGLDTLYEYPEATEEN